MKVVRVLLLAGVFAVVSYATALSELRATPTAVACPQPGDLPAAEEADKTSDRVTMDKLGCFPVMANTSAVRLDDSKPDVWHVILDPDGPQPMTAWARPASFRE
jgi:hypothetical protein